MKYHFILYENGKPVKFASVTGEGQAMMYTWDGYKRVSEDEYKRVIGEAK